MLADPVSKLRSIGEEMDDKALDRTFQCTRRDAPPFPIGPSSIDDPARYIVAIALALLVGMRRAHPITGIIKQQTREEVSVPLRRRPSWYRCLGRQQRLNLGECIGIDDRFMLTIIEVLPMPKLTDIDRIGQNFVKRRAT